MTKTHVTKWGVGWVHNSRKDPGCLENQVPMLLKGVPPCANEACSLVAPGVSLGRPSKLPLKHPQTGENTCRERDEEACTVWDKQ